MEVFIRRRKYIVTETMLPDDAPVNAGTKRYELKGVKGAHYYTVRNAKEPHLMFLCNARGFGIADPAKNVWLSDKDGTLKVV